MKGLQAQLSVYLALILGLAALGVVVLTYAIVFRYFLDFGTKMAQSRTDYLEQVALGYLENPQKEVADREIARALSSNSPVKLTRLIVRMPNGTILYELSWHDKPTDWITDRVITLPLRIPKIVGTLEVHFSFENLSAQALSLVGIVGFMICLIFGGTWLLLVVGLRRNVIAPLVRLSGAASGIDGHFKGLETLELPSNEIGSLTLAIQSLAATWAADYRAVEALVQTRTLHLEEKNEELRKALNELNVVRRSLESSQRLASLGRLVAGVAHEVNTPLGNAVTAASYFRAAYDKLQHDLEHGKLSHKRFKEWSEKYLTGLEILQSNLERAANFIRDFKKVAVDQSADQVRTFVFKSYIEDVIGSLHPMTKKFDAHWKIEGPEFLKIRCNPGHWAQIVTNLVQNTLVHGWKAQKNGKVKVQFDVEAELFVFRYQDDGEGFPPSALNQLFEPFFTTARDHDGSGLGLYIIQNIVVHTWGGTLSAGNLEPHGAFFVINVPARDFLAVENDEKSS